MITSVEDLWLVSAGFPSVSRNRDAYQSIDQQDDSSTSGNPFNQTPDSKPGVRTYWTKQPMSNAVFSFQQHLSSTLGQVL